MTLTRRLLTALLVALSVACVVPGAASALIIGVGDETPQMFSDPRFIALGIHNARISVAWDALRYPAQAARLNAWLQAARADGVAPLITFDHHYPSSVGHPLPTVGEYLHEFRVFRARYPWVHDFATWNEANYCGELTCRRPALVASYYRAIHRDCPSCVIVAAELLDEPNMVTWVHAFDKALGHQPAIWGLHNYIGANRLQTQSTQLLLNATTSEIWFTETGGLVARNNDSAIGFPQNANHAALVTHFILYKLAHLSPRISRVYIYQWNAGPGAHQSWDSGLVGPEPDFRPRPAFGVFVRALETLRSGAPGPGIAWALLDSDSTVLVGALYSPAVQGASAAMAPRALAGTITVHDRRTGEVVALWDVAAAEHFAIPLPPGVYTVTAKLSGSATPSAPACTPGNAELASGHDTVLNLSCAPAMPTPTPTAKTPAATLVPTTAKAGSTAT